MNLKSTLLPAIAGTSLMTISSYVISHSEEKNFSEPELLARIEKRLLKLSGDVALPAGWVTHYTVGVVLTYMHNFLKEDQGGKSILQTGIIFGASTGFLAILAWKHALSLLPRRSKNFYNKYYTQLFLVHFVFAFTVLVTQRTMHNA